MLPCFPVSQSTNLDFFVDIHAHSTLTNGFMYGNMHEDEERNERESLLPHLLSRCAEDFSLSQTDFNNHSIKAGTDCRLGRNLALTFYEYYQHQGLFGKRAHRRQLFTRSRSSSSGNLSSTVVAPDRHSDGEDQVLQEPFKLPPGIKRLEDISTPESEHPTQQLSRRDSDTLSLQETEIIFDDFSNCFDKAVSSDAKMCK
nr:unnamed protein product [Spirometra erinaceieuropaei]